MWDNYHDAQMRAMNTVVMFGKSPVYIRDLNDRLVVNYRDLLTGDVHEADIANPKWDWRPVKCGYVNYKGGAYHVSRIPIRKWKQGLHRDNIRILPSRMGLEGLIKTSAFANCVVNKYPSFEEALGHVKGKAVKGMAYHRDYAIVTSELGLLWLMYRGEKVGWFEGNTPHLGGDYTFLREHFEEVLQEQGQ